MPIFKKYAEYYDAFYADKDYAGECSFLESVFTKYSPRPVQSILDLGCGTGGHSLRLAETGHVVTGVDQSEDMLSIAEEKKRNLPAEERLSFIQSDIRSLRLSTKFDAVVSMFAVLGYLVSNDDIQNALQTARCHLDPGGLFIFDLWHGPGVLTDPPTDRYKFANKGDIRLIRFAHPQVDILQHKVDVFYKYIALDGKNLVGEEEEVHSMRFFFPQEIAFHLDCAGFKAVRIGPFLDMERELKLQDWTFSIIAQAV